MPEYALTPTLERPAHLVGGNRDYTTEDIVWVASQFQIEGPISVIPFPGKGNINLHTYEINGGGRRYLLQKVNSDVFTLPHRVMRAMEASIAAQREGARAGWEPIELVRTRDGKTHCDLSDHHGFSVWRMMVRIEGVVCHKSLASIGDRTQQLKVAAEAGRGLAIYSDLTATIDPDAVEGSLPGYRNTPLYFAQFHSVLSGRRSLDEVENLPEDETVRRAAQRFFLVEADPREFDRRVHDPAVQRAIDLVLKHELYGLTLWKAREAGTIRNTLIHGDTKIENYLFAQDDLSVRSLVDLDTIMAYTWLADWGDMARSFVNVAGETERDLSQVRVDQGIYRAAKEGFMSETRACTAAEVALMEDAVRVIALELGVRFLTDYLRGDTYFQLGPDDPRDLNRTRALVQLDLFEKLSALEA